MCDLCHIDSCRNAKIALSLGKVLGLGIALPPMSDRAVNRLRDMLSQPDGSLPNRQAPGEPIAAGRHREGLKKPASLFQRFHHVLRSSDEPVF